MLSSKNYKKSNKITEIRFQISDTARDIVSEILGSELESERQDLSSKLLDELCDLARIDVVNVKISDKNQYHRRSQGRIVMRQYGYYRPKSKYIYITNRTAARSKPLAPKTFLNTLLHEWVHHYDTYALGLNTIHTSGFYKRLSDLQSKLI